MDEANEFLASMRWIRSASSRSSAASPSALPPAASLSSRAVGQPVTDRRSSWVRRIKIDLEDCYIKVYDYPTRLDRCRGALRTTWLARSRALREWDALCWLRAHGFAAPAPLGVAEARRHGLLRRALLCTAAWPGRDLQAWLPELRAAEQQEVLRAVSAFVHALHAEGFRDRNLDPRNILARYTEVGSVEIAKIDSPRFRLVAADGLRAARLAREDLERLARGLAGLGLTLPRPGSEAARAAAASSDARQS
jgi:hypothetical protein